MSAVLKTVPRKKKRTVNVSTETYVSVDVDVDLADIPTEDLVEELSERDGHRGSYNPGLDSIYEAMSAGNRVRALELMREYLQAVTGRVLP